MDPRRGKATRTASKAGAAAPKVSAPRAKGALTKPTESRVDPEAARVDPEAARPDAQKCGSTRASGSQRKKSAPGPQERPEVGARGVGSTGASGSQRKKSAPGPQERPKVGARGAGSNKAPLSAEDAVDGPAGLMEGPELPLSRTGSRRDGGARAARERRPPPTLTEVSDFHSLVRVPSLCQGKAVSIGCKLRAVLKKLRLSLPEISEAAKIVNKVVEQLLQRLRSVESEFRGVTLLSTGSYYEHVKISAPNEFDVMFRLKAPRIELEEYCNSGAYYFVKFKRIPGGNPLSRFVEKDKLSASLMLNEFRKIIKDEIKNIEEETWRISFSHIEKLILGNHGNSKTCCEENGEKCCRKDCLKLMKYLLEQLKNKFEKRKNLKKFCSYHVKTAFFHTCTQAPSDDDWLPKDLEVSFDRCVEYFLQCLRTEDLKHYFIPGFNLFSRDLIDRASKEFLSKQIEYEKNNGFPVFDEI
ncbi:cyclic GMP-AMP synthase isoform 2-T2 [Hipposideros larvatus]